MASVLEGGCQCGAVRYRTTSAPIVVAVCHCTMCRRASAAPAVAWAMFEQAQVALAGTALTLCKSSPEAWDSERLPWLQFADELLRHTGFPPLADRA